MKRKNELRYRVRKRTAELRKTNMDLVAEIAHRNRAEGVMREHEKLIQAILDNSPNLIFLKDAEGRYLLINKEFERALQVSQGEIRGKRDDQIFPAEQATAFRANDLRVLQERVPMEFEEVARQDDGPHTSIDHKFPLIDADGNTYAIGGIATDIQERKRAQEELRDTEERFRLLVESVKDHANSMLDPAGRVTRWNAGAERIKGNRADEIIGRHYSCFYPPEDLARGKPQMALQVAATEGRFEEEGWRVRKDGSRFWANAVLTSLRDLQGNLVGFSKITRDLTERKRAEEGLQTARVELVRVATMGEFTASIAHEINPPLAAVVTNANACSRLLASNSPDLDEVRQAVDDIAEAGARAGDVISRIRALTKKAVLEKTRLDINEVILEVFARTRSELHKHEVSVQTELCPGGTASAGRPGTVAAGDP